MYSCVLIRWQLGQYILNFYTSMVRERGSQHRILCLTSLTNWQHKDSKTILYKPKPTLLFQHQTRLTPKPGIRDNHFSLLIYGLTFFKVKYGAWVETQEKWLLHQSWISLNLARYQHQIILKDRKLVQENPYTIQKNSIHCPD